MSFVQKLTGGLVQSGISPANRKFFEAAVGAAALAGSADGPIDFVKRSLLDKIIENVDALRSLEVHVVIDYFGQQVDALAGDRANARQRILERISQLVGDSRQGEVVVKIACAMGRTGVELSPASRAEVEAISEALGLAAPAPKAAAINGAAEGDRHPYVIALANQKGGTGKSTMGVHLAVALAHRGCKVGCLDLDGSQGTLSHYFANRKVLAEEENGALILPTVVALRESDSNHRELAEKDEEVKLNEAKQGLGHCDVIVIDTPGSDSHLAKLGCGIADTLITPLNDSLLDIDVLAKIDPRQRVVLGPSDYCQRIWRENEKRAISGRKALDWVVLRNRLAQLDAKNSREVAGLLGQLAERLGFRLVHGMSERVIFREMFLRGLTLLDLPTQAVGRANNNSHDNARLELDHLIDAIGQPWLKTLATGALAAES